MTKVNRTVLHESVCTIQELQVGGSVRTKNDLFMDPLGTLYQYIGAVPYTVAQGTVITQADLNSPTNPDGKWIIIGGSDSNKVIKELGYTVAGSVINHKNELLFYKGMYYQTLSDVFPVNDLTEPENTDKWVCLGAFITAPVSEALNFSSGAGTISNTQFRLLCRAANHLGEDISNRANLTAYLTGTDKIVINYGFNWNNSRIDASEFTGVLSFSRKSSDVIVHNSTSPVIAKMKQGGMVGGQLVGLRGDTTLNDSLIIIKTKTPFYKYRGSTVLREEVNYLVREGTLEAPMRYSISPDDLVSVIQYKSSPRVLCIGNFEYYIGSTERSEAIEISNSKVYFSNVSIPMSHYVYKEKHPTLITVSECDHFKGYNISASHATFFKQGTQTGYTYNFVLSYSFDVVCEAYRGYGDGWGSTGGNHCTRVVYKDCTLSRIDFHNPVYDYMKVIDCNVGNWGILGTFLGDLYVQNTKFVCEQNQWLSNTGVIRTRSDAGGFSDGNLYLSNVQVQVGNNWNVTLFKGSVGDGTGSVLGSPINYTFFNSIVVDGLTCSGNIVYLQPDVQGTGLKYPSVLRYSRVQASSDVCGFEVNLKDVVPNTASEHSKANLDIKLSDCTLTSVSVSDTAGVFSTKLYLENCTAPKYGVGSSRPSPIIGVAFKGSAVLNDCEFSHLSFYSGGFPTVPVTVNVLGGCMLHSTKSTHPNVVNGIRVQYCTVLFNGTTLSTYDSNNFKDLVACSFSDCDFYITQPDGSRVSTVVELVSLNSGDSTVKSSQVNYNAQYCIVTGSGSNAQSQVQRVPPEGRSGTYICNDGTFKITNTRSVFSSAGYVLKIVVPSRIKEY